MSQVRIRNAVPDDIGALLQLQHDCYPTLAKVDAWNAEQLRGHLERFPEGQFVAEIDGRVVAYCANARVRSADALRPHTYRGLLGGSRIANHDPQGDVLYGVEIMVHPFARRRGVGTRFYEARFDLVRRLGLRAFVSGGRLPGYRAHADRMTPDEYVARVIGGHLEDRTLSMQLKAGLKVRGVLHDYLDDPNSRNCASLLVWPNPDVPEVEPPARSPFPEPPPPPRPGPLSPNPFAPAGPNVPSASTSDHGPSV